MSRINFHINTFIKNSLFKVFVLLRTYLLAPFNPVFSQNSDNLKTILNANLEVVAIGFPFERVKGEEEINRLMADILDDLIYK